MRPQQTLTDEGGYLLARLHMEGVTYRYAEMPRRWTARVAQTRQHWFYAVQSGSCFFERLDKPEPGIRLDAGDVLGVVHDIPHSLRDSHATELPSEPPPLPLRLHGSLVESTAAPTRIFVGAVPCASDPLSALFPTLFHVPMDGSRESKRIAGFVRLIENELDEAANVPGAVSVIRRLSELIVVELLRVAMRRESETNPVWVGGLVDRAIAKLVAQLHADPGRAWTLDSMSRAAGLSRSALDRRFHGAVGESPKRYLQYLRMRRAAALLADGTSSIAAIAETVGYESEFAFHRAFRRTMGVTPGEYARSLSGASPVGP